MTRQRPDTRTLDLLDWRPPDLAPSFRRDRVQADNLRSRIARGLSETLRDSKLTRDGIALKMGVFLGEDVSKSSIDQYSSQAREDQTISAIRLAALVHATGDRRLIQLLLEPLGLAAVPERYLPAIEDALLDDKIEELSDLRKQARRQWRGKR